MTPPGRAPPPDWAGEHDIRELAAEAYAIRVLDALSSGASPVIRHHDGVHLTLGGKGATVTTPAAHRRQVAGRPGRRPPRTLCTS